MPNLKGEVEGRGDGRTLGIRRMRIARAKADSVTKAGQKLAHLG